MNKKNSIDFFGASLLIIFSILLGLVMAAVGFDIISGKPRMIFFDLVEFSLNFVDFQ